MPTIALLLTLLRIPVIFGAGETISHVVDADMSGDPELRAELGFESPAIGYKYEYFSMFLLDLWTGAGQVVLYDQESDIYVPMDDEAMLALTGRRTDSISVPFAYRVPLGWIALTVLGIFGGAGWWLRMRELD